MITYNMCFADVVAVPVEDDGSAFITDLIIPSFFILGMSLVIIEVVAYIISKKKKAEETDKIEDITYKTSILVVLFWILFIISYLYYDGGLFWGILLLIGSVISIIFRKKEKLEISNKLCALVILLSIVSFLFLIDMPF